ncbi:MAG: hypothetical protein Q9214_003434, partial [Letrouitia sp. 1 TL-2023]
MSFPPTLPAFTRSLRTFQDQLLTSERESFSLTTYDDLKISIETIQKEQRGRRCVRNLNTIKPFLVTLQQYTHVIEQFVNAKAEFLAFIWGPIKLCLQIASRLVDAFDLLLDAYARIGESLPVIAGVDSLFSLQSNDPVQGILTSTYDDILKFHTRAVAFFRQKVWTIAFKTTFRSFDSMYGDIVKNLQRTKELLIQSASIRHFQEAQAARTHDAEAFEAQRRKEEHERKSFVINWLSHVPCRSRHQELQNERKLYPGSTRWLFDTTQTSEWFRGSERSSQILWINGIPGAGKTFLFSSVIDEIIETLPNAQVIYFYCRYNEPRKTNLNDVLRSLIAQVLVLNPACLQYLYDNMIENIQHDPSSTNELCLELLENLVSQHDQLFIGVDGLDECGEPERQQILPMIHRLAQSTETLKNVRIFLTSRKEKDIDISFRSTHRLEIRPYHVGKVIEDYVRVRVRSLNEKFSIPENLRKHIITDIATRSHGMFLLARLILDNLLDQDCYADLEEELNDKLLPNGIDQAYARILDRMRKKNQPKRRWLRAKAGLDILTMATRQLKAHELQGALSIHLEDRSIDFEKRKSVGGLEELLGPIVELHSDGSVNFIHPTARDFRPHLDDAEIKDNVLRGDYAFQEYSVLNWIHHARDFLSQNSMPNVINTKGLHDSISILYEHHLRQFQMASNTSITIACNEKIAALAALQKANSSVEDIRTNKADQ